VLRHKRWAWVAALALLVVIAVYMLLFAPLIPLSPNPAFAPTAEYLLQHPAPKPGFLFLDQQGGICLRIGEKSFAQYGVPPQQLSDHIRKNFTLNIDGVQVQNSPYIFHSSGGTLNCDGRSPNLKCWGSSGICYDKRGLNEGLHLAEFTLTSLSGEQYAYQWAFTSVSETPTP